MSTTTDVALEVDVVLASGWLHGWLGIGQLQFAYALILMLSDSPVFVVARRTSPQSVFLCCVEPQDDGVLVSCLIAVAAAIVVRIEAAAIKSLLCFNPEAEGMFQSTGDRHATERL